MKKRVLIACTAFLICYQIVFCLVGCGASEPVQDNSDEVINHEAESSNTKSTMSTSKNTSRQDASQQSTSSTTNTYDVERENAKQEIAQNNLQIESNNRTIASYRTQLSTIEQQQSSNESS